MIFQHTWQKVMSGEKVQTRRLVKPGEFYRIGAVSAVMSFPDLPLPHAMTGRVKWQEGRDYAVQPGRGKPSVGRIRVLRIRREDVRYISNSDARAEGYADAEDFLHTWTMMHDKTFWRGWWETDYSYGGEGEPGIVHGLPEQAMLDAIAFRPAERYQAWALTFRLVDKQTA